MRILIVVHGFPPYAQGGAEIYAAEHARTHARTFGDEVHVLTREQRPGAAEYAVRTEQRDGITITWINNTFRDVRTFEESYRCAPIAAVAARAIDAFRPDVAHVHHLTCLSTEIPSLLASRGVPVLFTLHDYWLMCHRGQLLDTGLRRCEGPGSSGCGSCVNAVRSRVPSLLGPAAGLMDRHFERQRARHMRSVCGHVTWFLAPSRAMRDRFIAFGIAPGRIELSPYGFDMGALERASTGSSAQLRIGFLGTLMVSKGPHVLLEAVQQLPAGSAVVDLFGAQMDYHGDTSYRTVLDPLLRVRGVRVHGHRPHHEVRDALASLDVLVVPSIWEENSPLVIREAFLMGVPVVASRIGGIPEIVDEGRNGLLFEAGDAAALRQALSRLIEEPGLLDRLRAGAAATPVRSIEDDVNGVRRRVRPHESTRVRGSDPRLAAIVLNYRTPDDTAIAVASLLASDRRPDEVIVVDNDAGPECRSALAQWSHRVTCVQTGRNLGFPGGMNAGIRRALEGGADRVVLVNSDVVVPPDCLGRLESALDADATAGIVGPLVLARSWPDVVDSGGVDYNARTGRMGHRASGAKRGSVNGEVRADVDAVAGCVMLVAGEVFERVGLLDERYFFSFEELDFCLRARAAGFHTRLVPDAVVYHEGSRAIGDRSSRRFYFAARNHLLLAGAHAGDDGTARRAARALFIAALNVAHAATAPGGSLGARIGATLRGIGDHVRGRYGPDSPGRTI
jgi:GT2 family glycosyltransferase/glycosyltransferase involved in cell wall biosynthesis